MNIDGNIHYYKIIASSIHVFTAQNSNQNTMWDFLKVKEIRPNKNFLGGGTGD